MPERSAAAGTDLERPACPRCREPISPQDVARHTEPVDCGNCRCAGMPACYTCQLMYCACEVHKY